MDKKTISTMKKMFDDIMHTTEDGTVEFWYARELMGCLGYTTWRRFKDAINRAIESCKSAEIEVSDHFADAVKMVEIGSKAVRDVDDILLTRYACYLIAQNGDPRKEEIAFAQSYFAVQTRKQELIEERIAYIQRTEARGKLRESEKRLSQNIYERGVDDAGFGRIRSKGDQALFGGRSTQEMKEKLGVSDKRPLADFLPTLTIAAKNLATEMTNYNVEEKDLKGEGAITTDEFMRFLQSKGIQIPRDIQLIGFDDNIASKESNPPLTTIHQESSLRAKTAIRCLEAMRDGAECKKEIVLPVELIKRESTRKL